jgi:dTMP kinase
MTAQVILFEGSDGAGKDTQSALLENHYRHSGLTVNRISFPRYNDTRGGGFLYQALKGPHRHSYEFAEADPYEASLYYAADRRQSRELLLALMERADVLILDRYVESNLLHQGGKMATDEERLKFLRFLYGLEYEMLELPKPDKVVYLSLPPEVSMRRARRRAEATGGAPDAVEENAVYVRQGYLAGHFYASHLGWGVIECMSDDGSRELEADEVHDRVLAAMKFGSTRELF